MGGPQHAYAAGLARSLPGSFKLPREQLTIEKISTEDLDALGHAHTDRTLLRVAYLRGRYDLLGLITGDLLAYAAAPAAVYPIEGEDP